MERYFKASLGFVMLAVLGMSVACNKTVKQGCTGCCEEPGVTKEIVMPITKEKVTLQFYNAMTPINYSYCEYTEKGIVKPETCRPNYDTVFDATSVGLNDVFAIGNYNPEQFSANNLRTYLRIQTELDTTNVWPNNNRKHQFGSETVNYGENGILFDGRRDGLFTSPSGALEYKYFTSGRYRYKFMIYQTVEELYEPFKGMTPEDTLALFNDKFDDYLDSISTRGLPIEGTGKEVLFDSVVGVFCIIRNDYDCQVSSCVGKDAGDGLLK